MKVQEARPPRSLGVAVGHRDGARFLQGEDVADGGRLKQSVHQRQFRRAGIAEDEFDTFAA